jgi:hypothetical protein
MLAGLGTGKQSIEAEFNGCGAFSSPKATVWRKKRGRFP